MSKVSVIVPAYNPGPHLAVALESVTRQTIEDIELIVIDDGSAEDLSWVSSIDERVRYIRQKNSGVSIARNVGVDLATSDLIAFLDQDDIWLPHKLAAQLARFTEQHILCHTGFDLVDGSGTVIGDGYGSRGSYSGMLSGNLGVLLSSSLLRRADFHKVGGFDPLLRMQQDLDLFLRLSQLGEFSYVDFVHVHYRLHSGNASRDYERAAAEILNILREHELALNGRFQKELRLGSRRIRRTYAHQAVDAARSSMRSRSLLGVARATYDAARLSPPVALGAAIKWALPQRDP